VTQSVSQDGSLFADPSALIVRPGQQWFSFRVAFGIAVLGVLATWFETREKPGQFAVIATIYTVAIGSAFILTTQWHSRAHFKLSHGALTFAGLGSPRQISEPSAQGRMVRIPATGFGPTPQTLKEISVDYPGAVNWWMVRPYAVAGATIVAIVILGTGLAFATA
jgi:hypothetical protein